MSSSSVNRSNKETMSSTNPSIDEECRSDPVDDNTTVAVCNAESTTPAEDRSKDSRALAESKRIWENAIVNDTNTKKIRTTEEIVDSKERQTSSESMIASQSGELTTEQEILDLANVIGYKAGDRFEVRWEIEDDSNSDSKGEENEDDQQTEGLLMPAVEGQTNTRTHWWGATLLEHDGRSDDSVAIRVLEYDPYPEGGFPESSKEDVIFLGRDVLVDYQTQDQLPYRLEGEGPRIVVSQHNVEDIVNATLMNAMQKNSAAWDRLPSSQQARIAEKIAEKKEKLVNLLLQHPTRIIDKRAMESILSQSLEE